MLPANPRSIQERRQLPDRYATLEVIAAPFPVLSPNPHIGPVHSCHLNIALPVEHQTTSLLATQENGATGMCAAVPFVNMSLDNSPLRKFLYISSITVQETKAWLACSQTLCYPHLSPALRLRPLALLLLRCGS